MVVQKSNFVHICTPLDAKVAELVDAHDSKSCIFGCAGSIPAFGTRRMIQLRFAAGFFV